MQSKLYGVLYISQYLRLWYISNIGNDTYRNGSQYIGSVLIDVMTVASGK